MATHSPTVRDLATYSKFFRDSSDFNVYLTKHAQARMREREIGLPQIRRVLKAGSLRRVERDLNTGQDKFRVAGSDADGRHLEAVVTLGPGRRVTVITAIA